MLKKSFSSTRSLIYVENTNWFGEYMTEQTLTPVIASLACADEKLEEARAAHEKYLIKQKNF